MVEQKTPMAASTLALNEILKKFLIYLNSSFWECSNAFCGWDWLQIVYFKQDNLKFYRTLQFIPLHYLIVLLELNRLKAGIIPLCK